MAEKEITWGEYAKHTNNHDCWILVDGNIYDVTTFLAEHPGGDDILLKYSGIDSSQRFEAALHSEYAKSLRDARKVGKIQAKPMPPNHEQQVQQFKAQHLALKKKKQQQRISNIRENSNRNSKDKFYTKAEIATHNTKKDCWVIYDNRVFDVTKFQNEHPGGPQYLFNNAGKDITNEFNLANHSSNAKDIRQKLFIGYVSGAKVQGKSKLPLLALLVAILVGGFYLFSHFTQQKTPVPTVPTA